MKKLVILFAAVTITVWALDVLRRGFVDSREDVARFFTTRTMAEPFEHFHQDLGRYPTTKEGLGVLLHAPVGDDGRRWKGPYIQGGIPRDPWGREYQYRSPAMVNRGSYDLWSLGPDGIVSKTTSETGRPRGQGDSTNKWHSNSVAGLDGAQPDCGLTSPNLTPSVVQSRRACCNH